MEERLFAGKYQVLRELGAGAEMHPAKMRDRRRRPTAQTVASRHRLDDPHVHGKRLMPPRAEK